jgi:hypothetical protein
MYGKLENGILTVVSYIDLPNGGRVIGINEDLAKELGLKEIIIGEVPINPSIISYELIDDKIYYIYNEYIIDEKIIEEDENIEY